MNTTEAKLTDLTAHQHADHEVIACMRRQIERLTEERDNLQRLADTQAARIRELEERA